MKKTIIALVLVLTLVMLCGCDGYVKSYSATLLVTSSKGDEASMEFRSFNGTYDLKLSRGKAAEHKLDVEASLGEGEMNVYIGTVDEKELLFTIKGGEVYDQEIKLDEKYANEKTVYIILESVGKCTNGEFEFEYN